MNIREMNLAEIEAEIDGRAGQPLLLNFWAIWCAPCVAELPDLQKARKTLNDQGGEVLAISLDLSPRGASLEDIRARMPAFLAQRELDLPVIIYNNPDVFSITERFQIPGGIPFTVAIDRKGEVVASHSGQASLEEFEDLVHQACRP